MISILVYVEDQSIDALAATLAALVPGVADGLVGDAVVILRRSDDEHAKVADAVGASVVVLEKERDPWRRGADLARRDWVLCLTAGDVPGEGWIRTLDRFVSFERAPYRVAHLSRRQGGVAGRLRAAWSRRFASGRPRAGTLIRRDALAGQDGPRPRIVHLPIRIDRVETSSW